MGEENVKCNGLNLKVSVSNGKLTFKPKLKVLNRRSVTIPLNQVKSVELLTKSIIPSLLLSFVSAASYITVKVAFKTLRFTPENLIVEALWIPVVVTLYGLAVTALRFRFGTLRVELKNGLEIEVKLVDKNKARKLITEILR